MASDTTQLEKTSGAQEEAGKKPWELRYEQDHPELNDVKVEKAKEPEPKKEETNENVSDEAHKDSELQSVEQDQQAKSDGKPEETQPAKEEAKPEEATENKGEVIADDEAYIKEYAERKKLSVDDAKVEIEKNKSIVAKYRRPEELAEAYRNSQSEYHKLKTSVETTQQAVLAQRVKINPKAYVETEIKKLGPEKLINDYRAEYPATSRDLDDEQVMEKVKELAVGHVNKQIAEFESKSKIEASNRRETLLGSLKDSEKSFYSDIKPILEKIPDVQILAPDFNYNDLVLWAKGKHADKLVKEAEERGYKRGVQSLQQPKIVGQSVAKAPSSVKSEATKKESVSRNMSNWEKDQARTMFASANMTDDEKFEAYFDIKKSRVKK